MGDRGRLQFKFKLRSQWAEQVEGLVSGSQSKGARSATPRQEWKSQPDRKSVRSRASASVISQRSCHVNAIRQINATESHGDALTWSPISNMQTCKHANTTHKASSGLAQQPQSFARYQPAAISHLPIHHTQTDRSVIYHFPVTPADPDPWPRCPARVLPASQLQHSIFRRAHRTPTCAGLQRKGVFASYARTTPSWGSMSRHPGPP